jgi:glycine/D-amino acid oxidase-like deaminating enzyme
MEKHALHVSIIGGGIGGLAAAAALQRQSIQVTVFERNPDLREIGAGLTLWANGVQVLRHLGLADALTAVSAPLHFRSRALLPATQPAEVQDQLKKLTRITCIPPRCIAYFSYYEVVCDTVSHRKCPGSASRSAAASQISDGITTHPL